MNLVWGQYFTKKFLLQHLPLLGCAVRAVFEHDLNLYHEAQEKRVMLASPATIMPLVLLIAHAWKQQKTVENASKLAQEITDLGGRLTTFLGHVVGMGTSLSQATKRYNDAANSWDARVYPHGSPKFGGKSPITLRSGDA